MSYDPAPRRAQAIALLKAAEAEEPTMNPLNVVVVTLLLQWLEMVAEREQ